MTRSNRPSCPRTCRGVAFIAFATLIATPVARADLPIELSDVAAGTGGFVINGIDVLDQAGAAVANLGDMNGDGLSDVLVSTPRAENGVIMDAGGAYVVFGKADTLAVELSDLDAGIGGFAIRGVAASDLAGLGASAAGDVNGDGRADVLIGALQANVGPFSNAGTSYVVFGKADTLPVELSTVAAGGVGAGGFAITGIDTNDLSGRIVSRAGDVNNDGLDDVLVGAEDADPGGTNQAGETYVVFGKTTTTTVDLADIVAGIGGFVINGTDAFDRSGEGLAGLGDINGDSFGDVAVGAFGANGFAGKAYVVFGKADTAAVALSDIAAGTGGFVMLPFGIDDQCGRYLAGGGDVNGDSVNDILVGCTGANPGGQNNAGQTFVVFGKSDTLPVDLTDIQAGIGGFVINGLDSNDQAGAGVAIAGDLNGDGFDDVLVGASGNDDSAAGAGSTYFVYGKADTTAVELSDVDAGVGGFVMYGVDAFDQSGFAVSGIGDINGDGRPDFVIGAFDADPGGNSSAGEAYVVFGPAPPCALPDLDDSGSVGFADLSMLLAAWGPCAGCPEDLDGNGVVGFADLDMLLALWGPCP